MSPGAGGEGRIIPWQMHTRADLFPTPIEDYALLSSCRTAALVSRDGSIDWLCLPRFDSASVFAALLGDDHQGRWALRPADPDARATRHYDGDTFTLITRWESADGVAEVHDCLPSIPGISTSCTASTWCAASSASAAASRSSSRCGCASTTPARCLVRQTGTADAPEVTAIAGPDAVACAVPLTATDHVHRGTLSVAAGEHRDLTLTWHASHRPARPARRRGCPAVHARMVERVGRTHRRARAAPRRRRAFAVDLRALTHRDTGGIIAAPTTSLPEQFGGERNWDYRFVWLRDASLTIEVLLGQGFAHVVAHWQRWLLRAIAGDPADLQIVYGIAGERDLIERSSATCPVTGCRARADRQRRGAAVPGRRDR
jgi:hypothetical protein